jgi:aspartyl-tRNA(Asn)/glutamyl-tRNA(Gln) amidotransferase subunit A
MTMADLMAASPTARGKMTRLGNLTGMPALVLPMGFATGPKLPISLQIMARHFNEPLIYRVAAAYEDAQPWAREHPQWLL